MTIYYSIIAEFNGDSLLLYFTSLDYNKISKSKIFIGILKHLCNNKTISTKKKTERETTDIHLCPRKLSY